MLDFGSLKKPMFKPGPIPTWYIPCMGPTPAEQPVLPINRAKDAEVLDAKPQAFLFLLTLLLAKAEQVLLAPDKETIRNGNGRGNDTLAHIVLGQEFETVRNVGNQDYTILTGCI